ncbi:MAG: hypothetical protein ABJP34_02095 [Erythrobacter sp.]
MTEGKKFPSTTMAQRAESPRANSVSAVLEKVDFPSDYISEPKIAGEKEVGYFFVTTSFEDQVMSKAVNREDFLGGQFNDEDRRYAAGSRRLRERFVFLFRPSSGGRDASAFLAYLA